MISAAGPIHNGAANASATTLAAIERALTDERLAGCQYAGLIRKPFTPDAVRATVARHLARS